MARIKKILANDFYFLVFISLVVIIIMEAPVVYGALINDKNHYYTGLNTIAVIDGPVYLSYLEQVKAGHFLFEDLFNSNDNFKFLNPFWLAVGWLGKIFNLASPLTLQIFRIILIPFFLFSLFKIISLLFEEDKIKKKICFIFSLIISGFGIFIYPLILVGNAKPNLDVVPIDLWAYEANNFMILRYYPHVLLATSLIFLIFYYFYQAMAKKSYKKSIWAGILSLILFSFHPFQIPLIYAITGVYVLVLIIINKKIDFKTLKIYGLFFLISLASVIYYLYQLLANKNIFLKAQQNTNWAPSPFLFILSFGLGLILALYYIFYLFKNKKFSQAQIFLTIWFLTNIILIYLPWLNFQRRMLGGFMAPLSILAFACLLLISHQLKELGKATKLFLIMVLFFFISLTNWFVYNQDFKFLEQATLGKVEHSDLVYVDNDIKAALDWYKKAAVDSDIILASYERGNLIPGLTGKKVYLGHPIETVGFKEKRAEMEYFFSFDVFNPEKIEFLKQNKITYIFYSDFEKKLGAYDPATKPYLQSVYKNNEVEIYKVNLD